MAKAEQIEQSTLPSSDAPKAACLLCGEDCGTRVWHEYGFDVKHCGNCGVTYLDPCPVVSQVDSTQEFHTEKYYLQPARVRADWLTSVCPRGSILEVGCGPGYFLQECRSRGYLVRGCEADPERANYCRTVYGIEVETAYLEESRIPDASFDVVFHIDMLSHFPDPIAALRRMARMLRPGGKLCFEVGVVGGISQRWYRWNGGLGCPEHRWFYSRQGIENVLARAGLKIESQRTFGLVPAMLPLLFGRLLVKPVVQFIKGKNARPWDPVISEHAAQGSLPRMRGIYRLGEWAEFNLRFGLGRFVPKFGPLTMFVAAVPTA